MPTNISIDDEDLEQLGRRRVNAAPAHGSTAGESLRAAASSSTSRATAGGTTVNAANGGAAAGDKESEPVLEVKKLKKKTLLASREWKATGAPNGREIFIDHIPPHARDAWIEGVAEKLGGRLAAIRILKTKHKKPRCAGLALVRYMEPASATRALEEIPKVKAENNHLVTRRVTIANTLYVGNLNKTWKNAALVKCLTQQIPGVVNFQVAVDLNNKRLNRGFGFCTFDTPQSAAAAHSKYYKDRLVIMTNRVLLDWADLKIKPNDEKGVYIANMPEQLNEKEFRRHFARFGFIEKVVHGYMIPHGRRRDMAIINFSTKEAARKCISEMDGATFKDKVLSVTPAKVSKAKKQAKPTPTFRYPPELHNLHLQQPYRVGGYFSRSAAASRGCAPRAKGTGPGSKREYTEAFGGHRDFTFLNGNGLPTPFSPLYAPQHPFYPGQSGFYGQSRPPPIMPCPQHPPTPPPPYGQPVYPYGGLYPQCAWQLPRHG